MTAAELDIWDRMLGHSWETLSSSSAQAILRLKLARRDLQRIKKLSSKSKDGTLSRDERIELEQYLRVGRMVSLFHSYARRSLKAASSPGRRKAS